MNKKKLLLIVLLLNIAWGWGQSAGDYRSNATTMNWGTAASWERFNGTDWVTAGSSPSSSDGVITIRNGHTVTVATAVTVDQVVVEAGGTVIHSASATVTLNNGSGTDLQIFGTWRRTTTNYTISLSSGATISVESGGVYEHAIGGAGGSIPTATWHANSILRIMNSATMTSAPTGLGQTFGIVEINIPDQTSNWAIDGFTDVTNEFRVISTGSGYIRLNSTKSFAGSFVQSGGRFINSLVNSSTTFTIGGNLTVSGGNFEVSNNTNTSYADAVVVNGNIIVNGGTVNLQGSNNANAGRLFVKGNLTISSGEIARTQTATDGSTGIYFDGTVDQTFTWSGGTINSQVLKRFYYKTSSGPTGLSEVYSASVAQTTVNGSEGSPATGYAAWPTSGALIKNVTINNSEGVTLSTNKTVNETLTLASGTFTLSNTLTLANGASIVRSGGSLSATPTFGTSVNVTYAQHTSSITTGVELPSSSSVLNNLTVNTTNGVTLNNARTVNGTLTLTNGILTTTTTNTLTIANTASGAVSGGSATAYVNGPLDRAMTATNNYLFPVGGNATNYRPISLNNITGSSPTVRVTVAETGASTYDASFTSLLSARNWRIEQISGTFSNATLVITESVLQNGTHKIGKSNNDQAGVYVSIGGTQTVSDGTITSTEATSVGYYAIGVANNLACTPPAAPGNPTSNSPQCAGVGVTLTRSGTPGVDITWYWQTAADGTNTDHSGETFSAATSGTYYIRAKRNDENCWSETSGSVTVTVNAVPDAPGNPTSNSPQCEGVGVTLTRSGTPGAGVTWYWQTASDGTNTDHSGETFSAATSGTYYIRARLNDAPHCWSTSAGSLAVAVNALPAAPGNPTSNSPQCEGVGVTLTRSGTPGAGVTWYWQTAADGTNTGNNGAIFSAATTGTYYIRARLNDAPHCWSTSAGSLAVTVNLLPAITSDPSAQAVCPGAGVANFSVTATGAGLTYQWQVNTGSDWEDVSDGGVYTNATTSTLTITNAPIGYNAYQYRCVVSGTCSPAATSNSVTLTVDENNCANEGDYRSNAITMNWGTASSWERFNGTNWVTAGSSPSSSDGVITIRNGHTVTVASAVTVDQVVVQAGGQVTVNGANMIIADGAGDDFVVNGIVRVASSHDITTTGNLLFNSGSQYQHARTSGTIPTAIWNLNSTCIITGATSAVPAGINQSFGNFTWNATGSSTSNNVLTPTNVRGTFLVQSTGTGSVQLQSLVIDGNYEQTGGTVKIRNATGSSTANIKGSFTLNGGTFMITDANGSTNPVTLTIDGACNLMGGTFTFANTTSTSGVASFVLKGETTIGSGVTFSSFLPTTTGFYFNRATPGAISINIAHPFSTGSIRNTFYYNTTNVTGINIVYNGTSAQTTVNGTNTTPASGYAAWPTSGAVLKNLTINNSEGVTMSTAKTVNEVLTLTDGALITTSTNIVHVVNTSSAAVVRTDGFVSGPLRRSLATAAYNFPVGKAGVYLPYALNVSASSSPVVTVEAFNSDAGAAATFSADIEKISHTEYWLATLNSGTFTAKVSLARQLALDDLNLIAKSSNQTGEYASIGGVPNTPSVENSDDITSLGYFVMAKSAGPKINVVGSVDAFGNLCNNSTSSEQSYSVSGSFLEGNIVITPPAGFEISTANGASFSPTNPITLTETAGTVSSTTIYVRFVPTAIQAYSGNITHTSSGATQVDVALSGAGVAIPNAPTGTASQTYCAGATVENLSATGSLLKWYDLASGGDQYLTSDLLQNDSNYFASQTVDGCESIDRLEVQVVVNEVPIIVSVTNGSRCGEGTMDLDVAASSGVVDWFENSTGGSSIHTGLSYTTPSLSETRSYWVQATANTCTSANRTEVVAYVGSATSVSDHPSSVNVCNEAGSSAGFSVTATGSSLTYQWEVSTDAGSNWNPISNNSTYSGVNYSTLTISSPDNSMNLYQYRCEVSGSCAPITSTSNPATLNVSSNYCGSSGDYRSNTTSGTWATAGSWQTHNGSEWVAAATAPSSSNGIITIRSGHTITVGAAVTVDQVVVRSGGQLTVDGADLTVADGTGSDLVVNGVLKLASAHAITLNSGATLIVNNGAVYEHARNGGTVPTATWNQGSELKISGTSSILPSISGDLQDVFWDSPSQTASLVFNPAIKGNLTVNSTGSGAILLQNATIDGDLTLQDGRIRIASTAASTTLIKGNLNLLGGDFRLAHQGDNSYHAHLTVEGNVTMDNNVSFVLSTDKTNNGRAYFYLKGDLDIISYTISGWMVALSNRLDVSGFYFVGAGVQTVRITPSLGGVRDFFFYKTTNGPSGLVEVYNGAALQNTISGKAHDGTNEFTPLAGYSRWPTSGNLLKKIVVDNSSNDGVVLGTPKTVNDSLVLTNGKLTTTSTNLLTMAAGSAASAGSNNSFVSGPMRKVGNSEFVFPVGKGDVIAPIGISAPALVTDHFTAEYFKSSPNASYSRSSKVSTINHVSDCEYWMLDRTNGNSSVSVQLTWDTRSCGVTELEDLIVARWNGTQWVSHSQTSISGSLPTGTLVSETVSSFSPFTLGSETKQNPLPVNLLYFNNVCTNDRLDFEWSTASEINNDYFAIELSKDGLNWTEIHRERGTGNSNVVLNYSYSHKFDVLNYSLARLVQVDFDGTQKFYPAVALKCNESASFDVSIYPNPANSKFTIHISGDRVIEYSLTIFDVIGNRKKQFVGNNMIQEVDIKDLPSSVYILRIEIEGKVYLRRLVVSAEM